MQRQFTLCLITKEDKILLGRKKRGFGNGLWNGFGGKVEPGETIERAAHRELKEEIDVSATTMSLAGKLHFTFADLSAEDLEVHLFRVTGFSGTPKGK